MKKTYSISNKIQGLQQMTNMGYNVPHFDFVPDYTELGLKDTDINLFYPPSILKKIVKKKLLNFNIENGISVRSASFDEDTNDKSSAGRYISFNGLEDENSIINAMITIWLHHRKNSANVICPIILQETHPSFYSGVAFKDGNTIIIESYYGACSNIVEGAIRPYTTIIKNSEITHNYCSNKNYFYKFIAHKNIFKNKNVNIGENLTPQINNYVFNTRLYKKENEKMYCVYATRPKNPIFHYEEKILSQIIKILKDLDSKNGVDIEWGTNINGDVYLYQYRKLTRKLTDLKITKQQNKSLNKNELYGIPVSGGKVEGTATSDINALNKNSILIIENDNIEDINILSKIKGIIAYNGGILSHLSIICREFNIPCIVGVDGRIQENSKILLDANIGLVKQI